MRTDDGGTAAATDTTTPKTPTEPWIFNIWPTNTGRNSWTAYCPSGSNIPRTKPTEDTSPASTATEAYTTPTSSSGSRDARCGSSRCSATRSKKRKEWLDCAIQGGEFLRKYGHDGKYDWYFSLTREGKPIIDPYNIFSYTFATMAFAQLAMASGNDEYAQIAKKTFDRILEKRSNPRVSGQRLTRERDR